jgi:histidine triad (HIT) family protein
MGCYVCAKHEAGAGIIAGDGLVVVGHVLPDAPNSGGRVYLGHLVVEPRRHVSGLGDLTSDEAGALGQWVARAARGLRAEHVYSSVVGHQVDHLHLHLIPRYPGTPREYWWPKLDEWPDAPMGGEAEITQLVDVIRTRLDVDSSGR